MTTPRCIEASLRTTFVLSAFLLVYPFLLMVRTPIIDGRVALTVLFVAMVGEKMLAMIGGARKAHRLRPKGDWTAPAVGFAYLAVMYGTITEVHVRAPTTPNLALLAVSVLIYCCAVALRYWAFAHLGRNWATQADQPVAGAPLIVSGPFRFVRHPIYLAACIEALAAPVAFGAILSALIAAVLFVPLELYRAAYEERFLRLKHGETYERYARCTPAFLPLRLGRSGD